MVVVVVGGGVDFGGGAPLFFGQQLNIFPTPADWDDSMQCFFL